MNRPYNLKKGHGLRNIYVILEFIEENPASLDDTNFILSYKSILHEKYDIQDFPKERQHLFQILNACYDIFELHS